MSKQHIRFRKIIFLGTNYEREYVIGKERGILSKRITNLETGKVTIPEIKQAAPRDLESRVLEDCEFNVEHMDEFNVEHASEPDVIIRKIVVTKPNQEREYGIGNKGQIVSKKITNLESGNVTNPNVKRHTRTNLEGELQRLNCIIKSPH